MTHRMEQIYTMIAACVITSINGEECIDAPSYRGTLNVTLSGYTCQRWDSQQPHQHTRNISNNFPNDASVKDANNYCRDVDGSYTEIGCTTICCKSCESNFSDELWCYTTHPKKRWEACVSKSDICSVRADYAKCQTLPENKNSTHCPNDTSFYLCKPYGESFRLFKSILYDLECETYECCPPYPTTTFHSVITFLSSTGSPGQNETSTACCQSTLTSLLKSTVKDQTSNSGRREGSTLAAEIATPSSTGNGWICDFYLFQFVLLMALLSCSYMYQK